jgi:peptidoglycan hydrolase-like protein with peptidoglycan-binding domain
VPNFDPANASPWLASLRASRRRRAEAARRARRTRAGRGGASVLLAAMTLVAGAAVAADGPGGAGGTGGAALRAGAGGSTVVALQRALGVSADGVFGPITRRAVRRFQRAHGLVVDGIAGPATLGALGIAATRAPASTRRGYVARTVSAGLLSRIASCESGGNPAAISAGGLYRGKYQFSRATWRAMGGVGDPAAAPEAVQDAMAARLLAARGTSPWPSCA